MLKNKYQRLNREERKKAREDYKNSSVNAKNVYKHITRLKIVSIFGMSYGLLSIIFYLMIHIKTWWDYIVSASLLIVCLIFYFKATDILSNNVNNYLIKKSKK